MPECVRRQISSMCLNCMSAKEILIKGYCRILLTCWSDGILTRAYLTRAKLSLEVKPMWNTSIISFLLSLFIESYIKFRGFWQSRLPFGFELLHHFLDDMNEAVKGLSDIRNLEDENKSADRRKWTACENLFRYTRTVACRIAKFLTLIS